MLASNETYRISKGVLRDSLDTGNSIYSLLGRDFVFKNINKGKLTLVRDCKKKDLQQLPDKGLLVVIDY